MYFVKYTRLAVWKEKPTVRYLSEFVEKDRRVKKPSFRHFIYSVEDAKWLQNEIEQQGLAKYLCGEYTLNKLNHNGQRINITIEIPRKDQSGTVTFTSGWMVDLKGQLRLATPYGDK